MGEMGVMGAMEKSEIPWASIEDLRSEIERGALSARELTDVFLERIDKIDPEIGGFVSVWHERAREAARRLDEKQAAGETLGPLHGIPIAIKDLCDVAGQPTRAGDDRARQRAGPGERARRRSTGGGRSGARRPDEDDRGRLRGAPQECHATDQSLAHGALVGDLVERFGRRRRRGDVHRRPSAPIPAARSDIRRPRVRSRA